MARQVGADEEDSKTLIGMTRGRLKAVLAKLRGNDSESKELAEARAEILNKAIDQDHAHKGALLWIRKLDKMEAVRRNEWLYHADLYRGHMGWDTSDLLRPETDTARRIREAAADEGEPATA